jgi:hypothetical protein
MWPKIIKVLISILPYVPTVVDFILRHLNIKKVTIMKEKIKKVADIIDDQIDFVEISKKVKNVLVRGLVASIEMFDGKIFEISLSELIDLVPDEKKWVVEKYLDAIIAKDWIMVTDTTADVINMFVDIPGATEDQEKDAYAAALVVILMFIKSKVGK